jgi:hypothetical protein
MNRFRNTLSVETGRFLRHGPAMIAVGLIFLVANTYWSAVPVTSGMALIALGATLVVASRFRCSLALPALIAAHLLVYSALYFLFVGAVLHAAYFTSTSGLSLVQALDLAMSIVPIVAAARIAIASIAGSGDAPVR